MNPELALESVGHGDEGDHGAAGLSLFGWLALALGAGLLTFLIFDSLSGAAHAATTHGGDHHVPPLWACLPFAGLLLSIAILPLIPATEHWWEHNVNRLCVALSFSAMTLAYYVWADGMGSVITVLQHGILAEYIPFIMLLFSLYVISGGISLRGDLAAHPGTNCAFLGVGALLASFIGTTGASMLLIRPLLQTNSERRHVRHTVIFFIFLVSNIGGCLLPIGDPPLFLGFLKGVGFLWTLGLWMPWAMTCAVVLVIYYFWDCRAYAKETKADIRADETQRTRLSLKGRSNFLWLIGVVLSVALIKPGEEFLGTGFVAFDYMRELFMLAFTALSLWTTPSGLRESNKFNYHAILEVAALFVGIFICMQVPIAILKASGADLPLTSPDHFYWATGGLSAVLDNAPTYMVFFTTAEAMTEAGGSNLVSLGDGRFIRNDLLVAISLGAVFMGAMTYIGNGPNFMVKSIAEQSGIKMPSFFGYVGYSACILLPVFLVVSWLFV
ncbi:MAG: sodium:proton antiporter [Planctomycetes bacterium]|nr:sodium:proton antiporter [Planctomycetota bacterium]